MKFETYLRSCVIIFLSSGLIFQTECMACITPLSLSGSAMDVFDQLTDPCRYDKLSQPGSPDEKTIVYVRMHVYSLGSIDVQNLEYSAQILLRYRWIDPRLRPQTTIQHGGDPAARVWTPQGYIVNEHSSQIMNSLYSIRPTGTIILSLRMRLTLQCIMDLQRFPFDSQLCPLVMESWSYNASRLTLVWEEASPIILDNQLQIAEYSLEDVTFDSFVTQYGARVKDIQSSRNFSTFFGKSVGNFSTLSVHFALKRQFGFYIMDYYIPSVMLVFVSWVTFWLDANATPARTVLGTSTLLTFITLSKNIGASLPKVSYIKSSEIWFIGCTAFIFSSLTEFAFVNTIWRRKKDVNLVKATGKHILKSTIVPQIYHKKIRANSLPTITTPNDSQYGSSGTFSQLTQSVDSMVREPYSSGHLQDDSVSITLPVPDHEEVDSPKSVLTMTPQEISNWIDKRSRIFFPIAFLIFNSVYWSWTFV